MSGDGNEFMRSLMRPPSLDEINAQYDRIKADLAAVTAERDSLQEQLGRRTAEMALAFLFIPPADLPQFHELRRALDTAHEARKP